MLERVSNLVRSEVLRPRGLRTLLAVALLTVATYAAAVEMRSDHPDSYVVKRGDTLWDIAGRFLQRPWLWPEIWQANPQIKNPHLIYPGDVLNLAYMDRVQVQRPAETTAEPINAVPLAEIEPFLKDLRMVDSIDNLPYVVGLEDDRISSINGQVIYAHGLDGAAAGQRYLVVRPEKRYRLIERDGVCCDTTQIVDLDSRGKPLIDYNSFWSNAVFASTNTEMLGYELRTQAVGTVTRGEVGGLKASTLLLDDQGNEVRVGDRLLPVEAQAYDLQFFPHPPKQQADYSRLQVMAVAGQLTSGGSHDVIAISGGSREGIDNGTVFSVWRPGESTVDHVKTSRNLSDYMTPASSRVRLPDEFTGHAMVFRTFDKVSYALVMTSIKPTRIGYELKDPDAAY